MPHFKPDDRQCLLFVDHRCSLTTICKLFDNEKMEPMPTGATSTSMPSLVTKCLRSADFDIARNVWCCRSVTGYSERKNLCNERNAWTSDRARRVLPSNCMKDSPSVLSVHALFLKLAIGLVSPG